MGKKKSRSIGLVSLNKNPYFLGTEELEGLGEGVGRRIGDSLSPVSSFCTFSCALFQACKKGNCWAVHIT